NSHFSAPVASASQRWGASGEWKGRRERRGEHSFLPSPPPRGLGKGSILRRGALSIRPRDANEGERVPTARTLCRAAHLLLGERPLCPRQFTGNLACANGPAPLCGRRRHWPLSVGTAAAPGPQAPGRCPRLYKAGVRGFGPRQPGTPGSARSAPLANRLQSSRHGPKYRGGGDAQSQGEKPSKCHSPGARRPVPPGPPASAAHLTHLLPQLRKPVVEKMRRDRINSSIEQLKLLLEQEFARHQPNSKLEKADILEMAVSYLKHSKAFAAAAGPKSLHQDYSEGYSWCLQEAVQFLTLHAASDTQMKLLYHFQRPPAPAAPVKETPTPGAAPQPARSSTKAAASVSTSRQSACGLWRPW
uniref:Hes family bHLH transcription factor 5 n=1 Tax=Rattus norvegicus TaxID=10116 RepID=A0ABK0LKJ8_RAT